MVIGRLQEKNHGKHKLNGKEQNKIPVEEKSRFKGRTKNVKFKLCRNLPKDRIGRNQKSYFSLADIVENIFKVIQF